MQNIDTFVKRYTYVVQTGGSIAFAEAGACQKCSIRGPLETDPGRRIGPESLVMVEAGRQIHLQRPVQWQVEFGESGRIVSMKTVRFNADRTEKKVAIDLQWIRNASPPGELMRQPHHNLCGRAKGVKQRAVGSRFQCVD